MSSTSFGDQVALRLAADTPKDGLRRYLVTDQSAFHGVTVISELGWVDATAIDILGRQRVDWARCAGPVLVQAPDRALSEQQRQRWLAFAERWRFANAMTYLEHRSGPERLAPDLNDRTRARLPERMNVVLRWFDNRVMATLEQVLRPAQRATLWLGCAHVVYADRSGAAILQSPCTATPAEPLPIELNDAQLASLLETSEADNVINVLLDQATPALLKMLPPDQHVSVSALLRRARTHGIAQLSDQVAYCHLGLELGQEFDTEPLWRDVLEAARNDGGKLVRALSRFKETTP